MTNAVKIDHAGAKLAPVALTATGSPKIEVKDLRFYYGDALALKGNQGTLHDDVRRLLDDPKFGASVSKPTIDGDHGRIETRMAMISTDIDWLQQDHHWPGLAAIGKVVRVRETAEKTTTETAYYLLSTALSAERLGEVVRSHWGVENRLHWRLDVVMNEDQARNRLGNGPQNLAILRHMAINVMQKDTNKGSLRGKFKRAGWDDASPSISSWRDPELWQGQGLQQELHELSQSPGEPGELASGDLAGLTVGCFFSAGEGFSTASHMPVETAQ